MRDRSLRRSAVAAAILAAVVLALGGPAPGQETRPAAGGSSSSARGDLVAGPFVNQALQTSAVITWAARPGAAARCEIASAPEAKVTLSSKALAAEKDQVHMARVEGLKAGTAYTYAVTCGGDKAEGAFRTLPEKGSRAPIKIVTYGDPQNSHSRHAQTVRAVQKELPFAFLLITGDFSDDSTDWPLLRQRFFVPARDLLRQTGLFGVRGNHEKDGLIYRDLFVPPETLPWYSFDAGNVHWAVLDQYRTGRAGTWPIKDRAPMVAWLDKDLSESKADWKIVSYHEPSFNVGGHGSSWGRTDVWPILEKHGVDFVLSGHSHLYERCVPIGPPGAKPVIQIISGGGGGTLYPSAPSPMLQTTISTHHYLVWQVEGDTIEMTAKRPSGEVIDRLRLTKTGGQLPKELMDTALTTADAAALVKVFKVQWTQYAALPAGGAATEAVLPAGAFPPGTTVTLEAAADCTWTVRRQTFTDCNQPLRLQVTPPPGVRLSASPWNGIFDPPLNLTVALSRGGRTDDCNSVYTAITPDKLAELWPGPEAVDVPPAPAAFAPDGRLDEWASVAGLALPSRNGARSECLRLAWSKDGLCGALSVNCKDVRPDANQPTSGDCLELNFEMDNRRRLGITEEARAGRILLYPGSGGASAGSAASGRAGVRTLRGAFQKNERDIQAAWRKTDAGYDIEFLIPAEILAPAKLEAGQLIGFHHVLYAAGQPAEAFAGSDRIKMPAACPFFWGRIRLGK